MPVPWRAVDYIATGTRLKFGLIMDDGACAGAVALCLLCVARGVLTFPHHFRTISVGVVSPTPAPSRALLEVASALSKQGHEVVPL